MPQNRSLNPDANPFQISPPPTKENGDTPLVSVPIVNSEVVSVPCYTIAQLVFPSYYHGGIGYVVPGVIVPVHQTSNHKYPINPPLDNEEGLEFNNESRDEICGKVGNDTGSCGQVKLEWRIKRDNRTCVVPFPTTLEELERSGTTTLMIRNIPQNIKLQDMVLLLDDHCWEHNKTTDDHGDWSMFDVVYVPMDLRKHFKKGKLSNLGYAFVNFTTPKAAFKFYQQYHENGWPGVDENKNKFKITSAHIQGKDSLVDELSKKAFRSKTSDLLPVVFSDPRNGFNRESEGTPLGRLTAGRQRRALQSCVPPTANESTPTSSFNPSSSHETADEDDDALVELSGSIASVTVSQVQPSTPSTS